ncbi:hypothetical protein N658DRAFT_18654 [Parathielavia hyrcaniae]|uniref:Uncharacterized protein n=1 Tax=Parathielavia hyrcaniae TaxID=113614 RepID=A0AAN6T6C0_9PEZI|nr:hypothetical protein N658DRAFT_18654 [Parathielavia hyrcaniae]
MHALQQCSLRPFHQLISTTSHFPTLLHHSCLVPFFYPSNNTDTRTRQESHPTFRHSHPLWQSVPCRSHRFVPPPEYFWIAAADHRASSTASGSSSTSSSSSLLRSRTASARSDSTVAPGRLVLGSDPYGGISAHLLQTWEFSLSGAHLVGKQHLSVSHGQQPSSSRGPGTRAPAPLSIAGGCFAQASQWAPGQPVSLEIGPAFRNCSSLPRPIALPRPRPGSRALGSLGCWWPGVLVVEPLILTTRPLQQSFSRLSKHCPTFGPIEQRPCLCLPCRPRVSLHTWDSTRLSLSLLHSPPSLY